MANIFRLESIYDWEMTGIVFIIIFGSLLHFAYDWSNQSTAVGIIGPVNESVWEHLKLSFWSVVIFGIIEYFYIGHSVNNLIIGKAVGILVFQLFIVVFFYSYTSIIGRSIFIFDISSYMIGAVLCQLISYKIITMEELSQLYRFLGAGFLLVHLTLLIVFTFAPPKLHIFMDNGTKSYGISREM